MLSDPGRRVKIENIIRDGAEENICSYEAGSEKTVKNITLCRASLVLIIIQCYYSRN
jgi:hypothetical protein